MLACANRLAKPGDVASIAFRSLSGRQADQRRDLRQSVKSGRVLSGGTTNSTRSDNLPKLNLPRAAPAPRPPNDLMTGYDGQAR